MPKYELRDYQQSAVDGVCNFLKYRTGHGYVVAPGGSGKSVMIAAVAERALASGMYKKVAVLARSEKLLTQNADKFADQLIVGMYCAGLGQRDTSRPVTVGSIQSLASVTIPELSLVLVDECDEINNDREESQYATFFANHPGVRIIGFTATPFRTKSGKISWGDEIIAIPLKPLMDAGHLMPPVNKVGGEVDLRAVRVEHGDYKQNELEDIFAEPELLAKSVEKILQYGASRTRSLVFCQTVKHAELVTAALRANAQNAVAVDGKTDKTELGEILDDFESGFSGIKYIVNCNLLTIGIDLPSLDMIAILRATKSKRLFEQMVYRGTRPAAGKRDFLLLDMGNNLREHGPLGSPYAQRGSREAAAYQGKICPTCEDFVESPTARECSGCGYQFPEAELKQVNHSGRADTTSKTIWDGMAGAETYEVTNVTYRRHKGKNGKPDSIMVSYWCGYGQYGNVAEWISPHSTSDWARDNALKFFRDRGVDLMPPISGYELDDLIWHCDSLRKPWGIVVVVENTFARPKKYIWERPAELDEDYIEPEPLTDEEFLLDEIPY